MRRKGDKHPLRMVVLITQLGINMMVPLFFCIWIGSIVYDKTGMILLFLLLILLGILSGFRSVYTVIRRFVSFDKQEDGWKESIQEED